MKVHSLPRGFQRCWSLSIAALVLSALTSPCAGQQPAIPAGPLDLAMEARLMAAAREALRSGNDLAAEASLRVGPALEAGAASSATLARRAAGVCGWLQSDNDYARAQRLARRTIERLAQMSEADEAERIERLYWEAWLEGHVLDHKARALELLEAAAALAPDDPRILEDAQRWAEALAEFGR